MDELKYQIQEIFNIIQKIDSNVTNSASASVEKIINIIDIAATSAANASIDATNNLGINIELNTKNNNTETANIILEKAASTAKLLVNNAAIKASNLVLNTAVNTIDNIIFDNNMYNKCLIHEIRTPITNIMLGLNSIESNIIEYEDNDDILNTINCLYKSLNYIEDVLTKFCIIKNGIMVLNNFEPYSIKKLINDVENLLQYYTNEQNIQLKCNINTNVYDMVYIDVVNITHCIVNLVKNAIKYNNNQNNDIITINDDELTMANKFTRYYKKCFDFACGDSRDMMGFKRINNNFMNITYTNIIKDTELEDNPFIQNMLYHISDEKIGTKYDVSLISSSLL